MHWNSSAVNFLTRPETSTTNTRSNAFAHNFPTSTFRESLEIQVQHLLSKASLHVHEQTWRVRVIHTHHGCNVLIFSPLVSTTAISFTFTNFNFSTWSHEFVHSLVIVPLYPIATITATTVTTTIGTPPLQQLQQLSHHCYNNNNCTTTSFDNLAY